MNNPENSLLINEPIAVIGMACRFPEAETTEALWKNLKMSKESLQEFSPKILSGAGVDKSVYSDPRYVNVRGILRNIEYIDANFFNISAHDAIIMDPQQRIFLEICWEALEIAGYVKENNKSIVSVFAGMSDSTYLPHYLLQNKKYSDPHYFFETTIGNSAHFLATKISYLLNLTGESINISTACSTSLVAIIKACQALRSHECDLALAGGVSIRVPQMIGYWAYEGSTLSNDGKCRAFDARASGTVHSNGAGVVVLKRLSDAIHDKDSIDAIIKSFNLNNDGSTKIGYAAPGLTEQARCIASAIRSIDPETITYIETHGSGTPLGDPVEIAALTKAFRLFTKKKNYCAIGSIKTNIGHTEVAAGVAGFIKAVLALKHKVIPASLHYENPNPNINFSDTPFYVNTCTRDWKPDCNIYRAGVSSFGIGGTNAHIVLEAAPTYSQTDCEQGTFIIPLSAKTESALLKQQQRLTKYLKIHQPDSKTLQEMAFTLQVGRKVFNCRKIFCCKNSDELLYALQNSSSFIKDNTLIPAARAWLEDGLVDWVSYHKNRIYHRLSLPTYPFERSYYWASIDSILIEGSQKNKLKIYQPYWELAEIKDVDNLTLNEDKWLIFSDGIIGNELAKKLEEHEKTPILVKRGNFFSKVNRLNYQIDPLIKQQYIELFNELLESKSLPQAILYCWNMEEVLTKYNSFISFISMVQSFLVKKHCQLIKIIIVTYNSMVVSPEDNLLPQNNFLTAVCPVIKQEHSVPCKVIDINYTNTTPPFLKSLFFDMIENTDEMYISYRNGMRFTKKVRLFSLPKNSTREYYRSRGVYVLIGGLGRIGITLARFLAEQYQANLVLTTRKFLPFEDMLAGKVANVNDLIEPKLLKELRFINDHAASLTVVTADILNFKKMHAVFKKTQETYKHIDGVFHLAGIVNDSAKILIKDINEEAIYQQINPKVQGTFILERLFEEFPPNFCVLFSSLASIVGGIGLGIYSASNSFLNEFAEKQSFRKSKTLWISTIWDSWEGSQLKHERSKIASEEAIKLLRNLNKINLPTIIASLHSPTDWNVPDKNSAVRKNSKALGALSNSIEGIVKEFFKNSLNVDEVTLESDFYKLGGDSLCAAHLIEMIEKNFSVEIKLADLSRYPDVSQLSRFIRGLAKKSHSKL
jgi:polyketide synthase PksJ